MEEVNILKVIIFPELVLKAIDTYTFIYKVWASQVQWIRSYLPMQKIEEMLVWFLGQEDPLEQSMAAHSSILAW